MGGVLPTGPSADLTAAQKRAADRAEAGKARSAAAAGKRRRMASRPSGAQLTYAGPAGLARYLGAGGVRNG